MGRERERSVLVSRLDGLRHASFLELVGEPGIGKTRLLGELRALAEERGHLVLAGRTTEFERESPYGLWSDALDPHLRTLDAVRLRRLGGEHRAALAVALHAFADGASVAERYAVHRALRALLERLAHERPVVLCLDDVQWADPASAELLAALARRPPQAPVLFAVAQRTGAVLYGERLELAPLTTDDMAHAFPASGELYALSGGNPFYLEQLVRSHRGATHALALPAVPPAVSAALLAELELLPDPARSVLELAAVTGEPFEPDVVAEIAGLGGDAVWDALELLQRATLIRPARDERSFAFRHPLVRLAVYEATPKAARLRAHQRVAAVLERRGAPAAELAHHVALTARRGDAAAIDLLTRAAAGVYAQAPSLAARHLRGALRLLPANEPARRATLLKRLAYACLGTGAFDAADEAFAEALAVLPRAAWRQRAPLLATQASIGSFGTRPPAPVRRRLRAALAELPDAPSFAGFALRMPLAGLDLFDLGLEGVRRHAREALPHARALGLPLVESSAHAMLALGHAAAGDVAGAQAPLAAALALLEDTDDAAIGPHTQGFWNLGWALGLVGRHAAAVETLGRAVSASARTGHGYFIAMLLATQVQPLIALGRLRDAVAVGEEAVDAAEPAGNPTLLIGAHAELALARLIAGDHEGAGRAAAQAQSLAPAVPRLWRAKAGWVAGAVAAEVDPAGGIAALLEAAGGPALPLVLAAERPLVWAWLADAQLDVGDTDAVRATTTRLEAMAALMATPLAAALAARSAAALSLALGDAAAAADRARHGVGCGPPVEAARARVVEGIALARAGRREAGVSALKDAVDALERFGAQRALEHARRELRRLGVRTWRRGANAHRDAEGLGVLTARERDVARLVMQGRRNADVARTLVISHKTVESHVRSIRDKLGATSRVELVTRLRDLSR